MKKEGIHYWILLPGLDGSGDLFNPFIKEYQKLDNQVEIEVLSLPNQSISYPSLIDYVIDKLPTDKEYGLLGESFSGPIAIEIASRNPEKLKALCLVATFAKTPHWSYQYLSKIVNYVPNLLTITQNLGYIILSNQFKTPLKKELKKSLDQISEETLKSRLIQISHINNDNLLDKIKVKTLILNAKKDLIISRKIATALSKIKKSETYWLNTPHFLLQIQPELSAQIIKEFSYNLNNVR